jgi:predicted dehydrogenase
MARYGIGIIGTGWVAGPYVQAFGQDPRAEVRAVCSREAARGQAFAAEHGLDRCAVHTDPRDLVKDDRVQVVVLCTPNHLHAEQAIAAADQGKHIVVEKPIALTWSDMQAMRAAVARAGVRTVVGFVLRWHPLLQTLEQLLAEGAIGRIFYGEVDYLHGVRPGHPNLYWSGRKDQAGSCLLTAGCHAVDALRWLVGREAEEVYAASVRVRDYLEYDGTVAALIKFEGGVLGKVAASREVRMPYAFDIRLCGEQGTIRNNQVCSERYPHLEGYLTLPVPVPSSGATAHHPFAAEVRHFLDCIAEGRESHCNLEDAIRTHEICLAADRSAETGRPVKLPLAG